MQPTAEVGDDAPTPLSLGGQSEISSGHPEELDNEMKEYIQMRMREAETEAIQEYLMLKSVKGRDPAHAGATPGKSVAIATDPQNKTQSTLETRTIHHSAKKDIPQSVIAIIESRSIHKQPLKRALLRDIHMQLASCGLLIMLLKQRIRPVTTPENPSGYKAAHEFIPKYNSSADDNGSVASVKTEREIEAINLLKRLSEPSVLIAEDDLLITAGAAPTNSYTPLHRQQHLPHHNGLDHYLKIPIILRITEN
jgi:hypothetical protein